LYPSKGEDDVCPKTTTNRCCGTGWRSCECGTPTDKHKSCTHHITADDVNFQGDCTCVCVHE